MASVLHQFNMRFFFSQKQYRFTILTFQLGFSSHEGTYYSGGFQKIVGPEMTVGDK